MTLPKLILAGTLLALASCTKAPEAPLAMPPPLVQIAACARASLATCSL